MFTKEILKQIKPKIKNESDKYSWNLYKFLSINNCRVYWLEKGSISGEIVPFSERENVNISGHLVFGWGVRDGRTFDSYSGTRMGDILRKSNPTIWSFIMYNNEWFSDVTDWFIKEYIKDGRCIFDRKHHGWMRNTENRYIKVGNNSCKCRWCGQWFERKIEKRVTIERKELWLPVGK